MHRNKRSWVPQLRPGAARQIDRLKIVTTNDWRAGCRLGLIQRSDPWSWGGPELGKEQVTRQHSAPHELPLAEPREGALLLQHYVPFTKEDVSSECQTHVRAPSHSPAWWLCLRSGPDRVDGGSPLGTEFLPFPATHTVSFPSPLLLWPLWQDLSCLLLPLLLKSISRVSRINFWKYFYLFVWQHWVFVAACRIFRCSMWDLVPWPGVKPRLAALGSTVLATGSPGKSAQALPSLAFSTPEAPVHTSPCAPDPHSTPNHFRHLTPSCHSWATLFYISLAHAGISTTWVSYCHLFSPHPKTPYQCLVEFSHHCLIQTHSLVP